jgi:hypothetical protein
MRDGLLWRIAASAATGAAAVPFFVLPALLTVDAPDIHGGHAIHLWQALGLAALGALLGAVRSLEHIAGPGLRRVAGRLFALGFSLGVVVAAVRVGTRAANRLAALLGVLPEFPPAGVDASAPLALGALGGLACLEAARRRPGAGAVVVLVAVVVAAVRLASMVAPPVPFLLASLLCVLGVLRLVDPGWLRSPRWVAVGGVVVVVAVVPPMVPALAIGAAALALLLRVDGPRRAVAGLRAGVGRIPEELLHPGALVAVVVLVPAVVVTLQFVPALGAALWPAGSAGSYRALPNWAALPTLLVAWVTFLRTLRGVGWGRVVQLPSWVAVGLLAAAAVGAGAGEDAGDGITAVVLACGVVGGGMTARGVTLPLRAGPVVLASLLGASLVRIAGASVLPFALPPAVLLLAGAIAGLGVALRGLPPSTRPTSSLDHAASLAVWACAAFLPMYGAVAFGLHRTWVLGVLASAALVLLLTRVRARWVVFGTFYATFAIVTVFKTGPSAEHCADVASSGGADLIYARFGGDEERREVEPYDVLPVPGSSELIVSFKRYQEAGGYLGLIDGGAEVARLWPSEHRPAQSAATWPERLEWDPTRAAAWVQVLAEDGYAMWEVHAGGALTLGRRIPLQWEPGNPGIDVQRGRLVVTFVPNRRSTNPLLGAYKLSDGGLALGTPPAARGLFEMADYVSVDAFSGAYYAPSFFDLARFALVEVDGSTGRTLRRRETFHPTVGVAADGERGRIYLTNATASTLEVRSTTDLGLLQRLPTGAFPRDVVFDQARGRLYVAGYGDGVVATFDVAAASVTRIADVKLGPLLRGLGLDPATGRVFGASGCGVFEVPTSP